MASHFKDPLAKNHLGNSREKGDASTTVKESVIEKIKTQAKKANLSEKDIANLLALADLESGFNPDAANKQSSASGLFQITDPTAEDALNRLSGSKIINNYKINNDYDRFNPDSNIEYGIAVYLDKKRLAGSDDIKKIYKFYNPKASLALIKAVEKLFLKYYSARPQTDGQNKIRDNLNKKSSDIQPHSAQPLQQNEILDVISNRWNIATQRDAVPDRWSDQINQTLKR